MSAHGLEGAWAEAFLKAGAGLAPAGGFQNGLADAKTSALEAEQVDSGYRDIAPQLAGLHRRIAAQQGGNHCQVFPLNQRDLARIAWAGATVIAGQPSLAARFHCLYFEHGFARFRAYTHPANMAYLRYLGKQFL